MYLYIHVYLNVPGICLKPPRSFRQSSFGSLFALARGFFFSSFFPHSRRTFRFPSISFLPSQKNKASLKVRTNDKKPPIRLSSSLFSLSLVMMRLCLYFFFCFCFFLFRDLSNFFVALGSFFPHLYTRTQHTRVRDTTLTKKRKEYNGQDYQKYEFSLAFHSLSFLFSSFLSVVRRFPLSSSRRKRDPFVEIGLGVLFLRGAHQRGFFIGKYLLTSLSLSLI